MIHIQIDFRAPQHFVWECLLNKTSMWWPRETLTSSKTRLMVMEDKLGGKLYEDFGNNEGIIWADIIAVNKPESIMMRGQLAPIFGGPNISFTSIDINKTGDHTCTLHFTETWMQKLDKKAEKQMKKGWKEILAGLSIYVQKF